MRKNHQKREGASVRVGEAERVSSSAPAASVHVVAGGPTTSERSAIAGSQPPQVATSEAAGQSIREVEEAQGLPQRPVAPVTPAPPQRPLNFRNLNNSYQGSIPQSNVLPYPQPQLTPESSQSTPHHKQNAGKDLLKTHSHPDSKYGGSLFESFATCQRNYYANCESLEASEIEAWKNVHAVFKDTALDYFHEEVKALCVNVTQVFQPMQMRFMGRSRQDRATTLWNKMHVSMFRKEGKTELEAFDDLVSKGRMLRKQLGPEYQHDKHLLDMLKRATKGVPWAALLNLQRTRTSAEYIELADSAIQSGINPNIDIAQSDMTASAIIGQQPPTATTPAFGREFYVQGRSNFRRGRGRARNLYDRRYGSNAGTARIPYRSRNHNNNSERRRVNPTDPSTGRPRECRNCHSIYHFVARCPDMSSAHLIHYASQMDESLSVSDILHALQDSTDEEWNGYNNEQETTQSENNDNPQEDASEIIFNSLVDNAVVHSILHSSPSRNGRISRTMYGDNTFHGICMDNGAENTIAGMDQYLAYCNHIGVSPHLDPSSSVFKFGNIEHTSLGKARIKFPFGDKQYFEYITDVVDVDLPVIFGLDSMRKYGFEVFEVRERFAHISSGAEDGLTFKLGHLWKVWPSNEVLFTSSDLRKLHRRFGHPSTNKLYNLLKRAKPEQVDENTRSALKELTSRCEPCQRLSPKPFVFQVSMPDDIRFNHEIMVDMFYINKKAILHVVDRGTHFSAAEFLKGESAEDVWNALISCWVTVHVGFPNVLSHDQGSAFTSNFLQKAMKHVGIVAKGVPVEAHNALSVGERYHGPLRRVFNKTMMDYPTLDRELALSIAVMALNNAAGPDGLIPSLLVFGMIPKIPLGHIETAMPKQRQRFAAMECARKEMETIVAEQRVKVAEKRSTPALELLDLRKGDAVLVFREKTEKYEGPYYFESQDGKTVMVKDHRGELRPFSAVSVKEFKKPQEIMHSTGKSLFDYVDDEAARGYADARSVLHSCNDIAPYTRGVRPEGSQALQTMLSIFDEEPNINTLDSNVRILMQVAQLAYS